MFILFRLPDGDKSASNDLMPIFHAALSLMNLNAIRNWTSDGDTIKIDFRPTNENIENANGESVEVGQSLKTILSEEANIDGDKKTVGDTEPLAKLFNKIKLFLGHLERIAIKTVEMANVNKNQAENNIAPESRIELNIPLDNLDTTDANRKEVNDENDESDESQIAEIHVDSIANASHSKSKHMLEESVIEKPENANENLNESKFNQTMEAKIKETSEAEKYSMEYLDEIKSTINSDLLRKRDGDDLAVLNDDDNNGNGDSSDKSVMGSHESKETVRAAVLESVSM